MKISHEVPLSLLDGSPSFNDYDYCLPHLLDKYPKYREYFIQARQKGRFIIMDNGLFEGVSHTTEDLIEKINLIQPDIFIVPDEWNDKSITFRNAKYWSNVLYNQIPSTTKLMVVMQGTDYSEIHDLYLECEDLGYKHFSFNHSSIAYQNMGQFPSKLVNQTVGRTSVIANLVEQEVIKPSHYIHLLGASLPQEFLFYKDPKYNFINSVDTSSPIINGILGIRYNNHGLFSKPTNKIEEFFELDLNEQMEDIMFNIYMFKRFVK